MPTIDKNKKLVTFINVFTVDPAKQKELVDVLTEVTGQHVCHMPGFVSASLHRSLDGTKVAMYAQWRSLEEYQAMRQNAAAVSSFEQALALAKFEPGRYEVVETFEYIPPS
jgi:heme-degrading monooxygenase HmoA